MKKMTEILQQEQWRAKMLEMLGGFTVIRMIQPDGCGR